MMSLARTGETCWGLVVRAAGGDFEARSVFCRTYLPLVRSLLVMRWRNTALLAEVEDTVQDIFLECLRDDGPLARADSAQGEFRGYLFGIVRHAAQHIEQRWRRQAKHRGGTEAVIEGIQSREQQLSVAFDREWARTLVREAGDLMRVRAAAGGPGAKLRVELLRARFADGLPIREIAAQWEMDPDAVHRAYAKAREQFHACLRQVVACHTVRIEVDLDAECKRLFDLLN